MAYRDRKGGQLMTFTTDPYQKDVRPNIGHQVAVSRLHLFPFNFLFWSSYRFPGSCEASREMSCDHFSSFHPKVTSYTVTEQWERLTLVQWCHTLGCFITCACLWDQHRSQDPELVPHDKDLPPSPPSPRSYPLATTNLFSTAFILSFWKCYVNRNIDYLPLM